MTSQTRADSTPRARDVLLEQVRIVALMLRVPTLIAAAAICVGTLLILVDLRGGETLDFAPERSMLPGLTGLLLPIAVWRGEDRFGSSFLWTLPVDRRWLGLARAAAGWIWLMAAVALFVLWQLVVTAVIGGDIVAARSILLLPATSQPSAAIDPAALQSAIWTPRPLLWLAPLTGATCAYMLASAIALGVRHPLRWIAGIVLGVFFISLVLSEASSESLRFAPSRAANSALFGSHGVDAVLTASTEHLRTQITLTTGQTETVWRGLPDVRQWAAATTLWMSIGIAALWIAAWRHREQRGGSVAPVAPHIASHS